MCLALAAIIENPRTVKMIMRESRGAGGMTSVHSAHPQHNAPSASRMRPRFAEVRPPVPHPQAPGRAPHSHSRQQAAGLARAAETREVGGSGAGATARRL